jgi:hypothetical protein
MSKATDRVIAEAAYAARVQTTISSKANKGTLATLSAEVDKLNTPLESTDSPIGLDTDGVPYIKTGAN